MDGSGFRDDARDRPKLPMMVLGRLTRNRIRRTIPSFDERRHLVCLAAAGFIRWCLLERSIHDGNDVTDAVGDEFREMLETCGVKRDVRDFHDDAIRFVLVTVADNKDVVHHDPGTGVIYVPVAGEIWQNPDRTFGVLDP